MFGSQSELCFPQLENLSVLPEQDWYYSAWYGLLHKKHSGYFQKAFDEAVLTSWMSASFGLRECVELSRHCAMHASLHFWNDADRNHAAIVSSLVRHGLTSLANVSHQAMLLTLKYPKWEIAY